MMIYQKHLYVVLLFVAVVAAAVAVVVVVVLVLVLKVVLVFVAICRPPKKHNTVGSQIHAALSSGLGHRP